MNSTTTFFVGVTVQITIGILQVMAAILFVYRWQRRSWQLSNIMKIREPLAGILLPFNRRTGPSSHGGRP